MAGTGIVVRMAANNDDWNDVAMFVFGSCRIEFSDAYNSAVRFAYEMHEQYECALRVLLAEEDRELVLLDISGARSAGFRP